MNNDIHVGKNSNQVKEIYHVQYKTSGRFVEGLQYFASVGDYARNGCRIHVQ